MRKNLTPLLQAVLGHSIIKRLAFCWGQEECTISKDPSGSDRAPAHPEQSLQQPTVTVRCVPRSNIQQRDKQSISNARARPAVHCDEHASSG